MIIMAVGQGVFNKILIHYSSQTVAGYQVAGRLDMLIFLPIFAIAGGMTTLVGMFYGAKEISALNQIIRYGIKSSFIILLIISFLFILLIFESYLPFSNEIFKFRMTLFFKLYCYMYGRIQKVDSVHSLNGVLLQRIDLFISKNLVFAVTISFMKSLWM